MNLKLKPLFLGIIYKKYKQKHNFNRSLLGSTGHFVKAYRIGYIWEAQLTKIGTICTSYTAYAIV